MKTYQRNIVERVLAGGPVGNMDDLDHRYELAKEPRTRWQDYSGADQFAILDFTEGKITLKQFKEALGGFKNSEEAYRYHSQAVQAKAIFDAEQAALNGTCLNTLGDDAYPGRKRKAKAQSGFTNSATGKPWEPEELEPTGK